MEHCVCTNLLRKIPIKITISPCRCADPGPGKSVTKLHPVIRFDEVSERQYNQRIKAGLPIETPAERSTL